MSCVFTLIKQRICSSCRTFRAYFSRWIKPSTTSLVLGTLADMTRGKSELLAENALLRHQLIILRRQVKHPVYLKTDRSVLYSSSTPPGASAEDTRLVSAFYCATEPAGPGDLSSRVRWLTP